MESFKVFTLLLAVVAAYITYRQYRVSLHSAKLELFDLRYNIYASVRRLYEVIISQGEVGQKDVRKFINDTYDVKFLFEDDVVDYVEELKKNAINLKLYRDKLNGNNVLSGIDYLELESELLMWFTTPDQRNKVFDKYMDLSRINTKLSSVIVNCIFFLLVFGLSFAALIGDASA